MHSSKNQNFIAKLKNWQLHMILLCILIIGIFISLCLGKYPISIGESLKIIIGKLFGIQGDWSSMSENVVLRLRLPRIIGAIIVGASLSVSGATYQNLFKNPLISPDFLGVSSGACIGSAIAILLSLNSIMIQIFAFVCGIVAVIITTTIPKFLGSRSNVMLVLSGVIVSGIMSSIMGLIKYIADPTTKLAEITYWQMGSLAYVGFRSLWSILIPVAICMAILFKMAWWIDIVSLGEKEAQTLGANVKLIQRVSIICATILTASSVAISGTIGWIGLVIPHIGRMIAGYNGKRLLPTAALCGAIFLLFVDTLGRVVGEAELPISILTGIIGAPFYAFLLYKLKAKVS